MAESTRPTLFLGGFKLKVEESRMRDMQAQTGWSKAAVRQPADYYVTPDVATIELLKREKFEGMGWEPACGNGAITKFFPGIMASDIRTDDIAGETGVDFLKEYREVDFIITNPPFKLLLPFVHQALKCARKKVAMFARIQFLEGRERYKLFQEHPPARIYVFSNRINCSPDGTLMSGIMCFCWFIWDVGQRNKPTLDWIICERGVNKKAVK